jgi:hypothetical protein
MEQYSEAWMPRKKKKRKFVRPKAGLKPGGPVNQLSHVGVRFHKGYVWDKLRYTVLLLSQMGAKDKALVEATLKTTTTAPQALTLPAIEHKDGDIHNNKAENLITNGWAVTCIDQLGKCYVVSYHGFEVCLFYKRQLHVIKLNPGDKHPEGVCQDPEEAWMRLDLFGQSAKRANFVLTSSMNQLKEEKEILVELAKTKQALIDKLESELDKIEVEKNKPKKRRRSK